MNLKTIGVYMDRVVTDNTDVLCMIGWYHASVVILIIFFSHNCKSVVKKINSTPISCKVPKHTLSCQNIFYWMFLHIFFFSSSIVLS